MYQDSKGYIWVGTIDGLQRYDGTRFVNYLPDMHDPEALHNGKINSIFEDSKKRFWIGTDIGAPYQLNRSTGKFYNYSLHQPNGNTLMNGAGKFIEDSNERVVTFYDKNIKERMYEGVLWKQIVQEIVETLPPNVFISFDIDGLDPKLCPHTGTPVPGGFETEQIFYLFKKVLESGRKLVGFDLNEVGISADEWDENVGARVLFKLCNLMVAGNSFSHAV